MEKVWRPSPADIAAAEGKKIPDVIAPGLDVLFCGINPGLYSGAVGHHFARPGNRFWPALHLGGFTERVLSAFDDWSLLDRAMGITNFVERASARADELTPDELRAGAEAVAKKARKYRPRFLAVLGVGAFRVGFDRKAAKVGLQPEEIGQTRLWVLPNPSGLNAHYSLRELGEMFAELRAAVRSGQ